MSTSTHIDLIENMNMPNKKIHNHGYIGLVDCMPRISDENMKADAAIVQAARVSYGHGTKTVSNDKALIEFLLRHSHTSPFEMVEFKFHLKMPLFIARQWIRHRTASLNEVSARYSIVQDEFYIPEEVGTQSKTNKQCTDFKNDPDIQSNVQNTFESTVKDVYSTYEGLLDSGISREISRMVLPLNMYTEFYWKIDLHNLFHFLKCRMHNHAQLEIRQYACIIFEMVKEIAPLASQAFEKYVLNAKYFSQYEVDALSLYMKHKIEDSKDENQKELNEPKEKIVTYPGLSKSETREFLEKVESLSF